MCGTFVELDPPWRLVFTFGWEQPPPGGPLSPGSTVVEVHIAATPTGSRLTLRHTGLPVHHHAIHHQGWAHFLARLRQIGPPS